MIGRWYMGAPDRIDACPGITICGCFTDTFRIRDTKEKDKGKQENRITNAEENLLNALSNLSGDQSSLEKVKAFSKHMYKAAEQEIKKCLERRYLLWRWWLLWLLSLPWRLFL